MITKKISVLTLIDMKSNKLGALEEYALNLSKKLISIGYSAVVEFAELPTAWSLEKFNDFGIIPQSQCGSPKPISVALAY